MRRFMFKFLNRRRFEKDLEAELAFHREMASAQSDRVPFGNSVVIQEQIRDLRRFNWIENLWRDLRYAVRALSRSPGFVLSALLSLGLGIGVNTTIFSLAVELLLSKPSVTGAESLAAVRLGGNSHAKPQVVEFVRQSGLFLDVVGDNHETYINWNNGVETRRIFAAQATKNYFNALGIPVFHGRGWVMDDPDEVVVLSYRFWRTHFSADPSVVGRTMRLDSRAYTVVGILPESHRTLIGYGFSPDVYVPRYTDDTLLAICTRLRPGMSFGEARAALQTIGERLDRELPESWKYGRNSTAIPVVGFARLQQEKELMTVGLFFVVLMITVGLVLFIACVNVAGLVLARSAARRQEIAIRFSLGASRGRLLQQLVSESVLLSLLGAAAGFLFALLAAKALAAIPLPVPIPIRLYIEPNWSVAAYAVILAMGTIAFCGPLPAWQSIRDSVSSGLQRERRLRGRRLLVMVQIAVSFVVLATGALFLQNLLRSAALGPGFDVRQTVRAEVHLPPATYRSPGRINPYVEQALGELRAIPGIDAAAAARIIPFTDSTRFSMQLTFADGEKQNARFHWNAVTPDFFRAMSIPILQGRPFSPQDRRDGKVVIVNAEFVKRYLGQRSPIGTTFVWDDGNSPREIVGVVRGTKNVTIGEDEQPQLYQPLAQIANTRPRIQFVLRSAIPPAIQLDPVRQALRRVEPSAGLEVATMFSSIGLAFLPSQVGAVLMGSIGALGLLLAAIGLYGVLAYSVTRRTREIGVRMAIGARRSEISRMILVETARLLVVGIAAGLLIAIMVTRPLSIFLVPGLQTTDLASLAFVVAVLCGTGLAAAFCPVRRAITIDPMMCLRYE